MSRRFVHCTLTVALCAGLMSVRLLAQDDRTRYDTSPHTVRFVSVKDGTRLEVLDWGGTGRPVVLLAGYQTAHLYDEFAPRLRDTFHVYGITRRGYGASDAPATGYTAIESADDVMQVLDALSLERPVLAGHSFGGQDATTIAAERPGRIAAIVYLNSAEDPTLTMADYGLPPAKHKRPTPRPTPSPDYSSVEAYRMWQQKAQGVAFPAAELHHVFTVKPDGSMGLYLPPSRVRDAIFAGRRKPAYERIRVPVLSFVPAPLDPAEWVERQHPANDDERMAWLEVFEGRRRIYQRHRDDLRRGVPHAREVELPAGNFYIVLSHPDDIARELRAFAKTL